MPMVYTPAHIGSEIFERLRSPEYTPSVSHSLDSSLREGAGMGCIPFNRVLAKIQRYGRFSSPLRNSETFDHTHTLGGHNKKAPLSPDCKRQRHIKPLRYHSCSGPRPTLDGRCNGRSPAHSTCPGAFLALLEGISLRRSLLPCTVRQLSGGRKTEAPVLVIALGV